MRSLLFSIPSNNFDRIRLVAAAKVALKHMAIYMDYVSVGLNSIIEKPMLDLK